MNYSGKSPAGEIPAGVCLCVCVCLPFCLQEEYTYFSTIILLPFVFSSEVSLTVQVEASFPLGTLPDHLKVTDYFPNTFCKHTGRCLSHLKGSWSQWSSPTLKETPDRNFTRRHFISQCHPSPMGICTNGGRTAVSSGTLTFQLVAPTSLLNTSLSAECLDHLRCSESITAAVN